LYVLIDGTWEIWKELRRHRDNLEDIQKDIQSLQDAPDDAPANRLLSREEAADRLRISVRTLDDMEAAGEIQPVRIRGRVLYHPEALEAFIRRNAGGGRR
jgi:excisionase family DNA binding protein